MGARLTSWNGPTVLVTFSDDLDVCEGATDSETVKLLCMFVDAICRRVAGADGRIVVRVAVDTGWIDLNVSHDGAPALDLELADVAAIWRRTVNTWHAWRSSLGLQLTAGWHSAG